MAELSDFLGHVLEEVTRARVQADREAIRTARIYASEEDGLLQNFAVPRMRLPNIEITMPCVITDSPEGYMEKANPELLNQAVVRELKETLSKEGITINTEEIIKNINEDNNLSKGYLNEASINNLTAKIGNQLKGTEKATRVSAEIHAKNVEIIREQINKTLNALPRKPVGIGINPTSAAIREYNSPSNQAVSNVLYLKLSITEEALQIDFGDPAEKPALNKPLGEKPIIKRLNTE